MNLETETRKYWLEAMLKIVVVPLKALAEKN